jgi:hypothetical protein
VWKSCGPKISDRWLNSGFGFYLHPAGGVGAGTVIDDSSALVNGTGIGVTGGALYLGNSVIIRNDVGVAITGGSVLSYKSNMIDGNLSEDGTPLTGIPLNQASLHSAGTGRCAPPPRCKGLMPRGGAGTRPCNRRISRGR